MSVYFGAIADDFTGATDIAGLIARSGMAVSLSIGVPETPIQSNAPFQVIALKSRTAPLDQATSETKQALNHLKSAGAQRFFFKYCSTFDSTPDGNIGPIAEMLMQELGVAQTIYCPAFPENGRSVYMGNLFVGQQPLAESPMRNHPLTPMTDSNLMRLLDPQVTKPIGHIARPAVTSGCHTVQQKMQELAGQGIAHVIMDAITQRDLQVIAQACKDMVLLTGGSAIAMPLPEIYKSMGALSEGVAQFQAPSTDAQSVVLSGSCSAMTNAQVARYRSLGKPAYRLDPLQLQQDGPQAVFDWLKGQDLCHAPLIYATAAAKDVAATQAELGVEAAGALIEQTLAACATLARDLGARRFVVAGGETSGAVTQALGVSQMDVGPEIAPGVPWCFSRSDQKQIALTLKSGNFGDETFFETALNQLDKL